MRLLRWTPALALAALAPRLSFASTADAAPAFAAAAVSASTTTDAAARYKTEGPVVDNAASFIGVMTVIPSAVVGAVACPVVLAGDKVAPGSTYQQRYSDCVSAGAAKGSQLFYTVGGYPFMMLKRVFWDLPIRAFSGSDAPRKSKPVDPGR